MHTISVSHPLRSQTDAAGTIPGSIGVEHDEWRAAARRDGAMVIVSLHAPNPKRALAQLAASDAPMDCWFKEGVRSLTGEDLPTLFS
jgi:hypothetical protein